MVWRIGNAGRDIGCLTLFICSKDVENRHLLQWLLFKIQSCLFTSRRWQTEITPVIFRMGLITPGERLERPGRRSTAPPSAIQKTIAFNGGGRGCWDRLFYPLASPSTCASNAVIRYLLAPYPTPFAAASEKAASTAYAVIEQVGRKRPH